MTPGTDREQSLTLGVDIFPIFALSYNEIHDHWQLRSYVPNISSKYVLIFNNFLHLYVRKTSSPPNTRIHESRTSSKFRLIYAALTERSKYESKLFAYKAKLRLKNRS